MCLSFQLSINKIPSENQVLKSNIMNNKKELKNSAKFNVLFVFLILLLVVGFPNNVNGQTTDYVMNEEVLVWTEKMPEYPGGMIALKTFITQNVEYPEEAKKKNIEETIYVRFVVNKKGKVEQIECTVGENELLINEAIRVVGLLLDFEPGTQAGKPVNVWFSFPISFQLNN